MPGYTNSIGNLIINADLKLENNLVSAASDNLVFYKERNLAAIQNADNFGAIYFNGLSPNLSEETGAIISGSVDGAPAGDIIPGKLSFATANAASGGIPTPRLNIDADGTITMTGADAAPTLVLVGGMQFPNNGDNLIYIGSTIYEHSTGTNSVFMGLNAGNLTNTGTDNIGIGYQALRDVTTGSNNTAIGFSAGLQLSTGSSNTIVGSGSAVSVLTGQANTIIGDTCALFLTSGNNNTCIGSASMVSGTITGNDNIAIGHNCLNNLSSGNDNIAIGVNALRDVAAGGANIAIGSSTGNSLITGFFNIMIGFNSGKNYTGAESSNILINNDGVLGESNIMRIGTTGSGLHQVNTTYIAGITGNTVSNAQFVTINSSTGQLGVAAGSILNYTNVTFGMSPYTVLTTDYYLSVNSSGGAVTIDLPNAPANETVFIIKDRTGNAATNNITVTTSGGLVQIDGQTSYLIKNNYGSISVLFNGTGYEVF